MDSKKYREEILCILVGSILYGVGLSLFLTPCAVILGGASGIAITLNRFVPVPIGFCVLILNLPLLFLSVRVTGVRGVLRTAIGVAVTSLTTDVIALLPPCTDDALLGAVFGGAILGIGTGIMLSRGYTTGGSDLAAYLIHLKIPRLRVGRTVMLIDGVIVVGAAIVAGDFSGILYSIFAVAACTVSIDLVMGGLDRAKLSLIVSEHYAEIGDAITGEMGRGVTMLNGQGWYTKAERRVVMCVLKQREVFALKELVREIDPNAFMTITDAAEVLGDGFDR